jgi:hypothetical protein
MSLLSRTRKRFLADYHLVAGTVCLFHPQQDKAAHLAAEHFRASDALLSDIVIDVLSDGAKKAIKTGRPFEKHVYAGSFLLHRVRYKVLRESLDPKLDELNKKYYMDGYWDLYLDDKHILDGSRLIPFYPSLAKNKFDTHNPVPTLSATFRPLTPLPG